jgi:hypothetical protein
VIGGPEEPGLPALAVAKVLLQLDCITVGASKGGWLTVTQIGFETTVCPPQVATTA